VDGINKELFGVYVGITVAVLLKTELDNNWTVWSVIKLRIHSTCINHSL